MEIEQLRQELNQLLENIVDHSDQYSAERPIPSLEVSFVLKKINKLKENLIVFKYLLEQQENLSKQFSNSYNGAVEGSEEPNAENLEVEEEKPINEESIKVEPTTEPVFEEESPEKENLEQLSISKLSDGLTLNDRYLFANELFDKDMNAFNELVKAIDECSSLDGAIALYSTKDWEIDNEHVVSFTNLVERRFS